MDDEQTKGRAVPASTVPAQNSSVSEETIVSAQGGDNIIVGDPQDIQRANLAYALTLLLAFVIVLQFTFLFVLEWNTKKSTEPLEKAFNVALPVISGLVSSAVTLYFAKRR